MQKQGGLKVGHRLRQWLSPRSVGARSFQAEGRMNREGPGVVAGRRGLWGKGGESRQWLVYVG